MADLDKVSQIKETHHMSEVNAHLESGWTLISTASGAWQDTGEPFVTYVLGWQKGGQPVKPKQNW